MTRGYLWQNLPAEVIETFASLQLTPEEYYRRPEYFLKNSEHVELRELLVMETAAEKEQMAELACAFRLTSYDAREASPQLGLLGRGVSKNASRSSGDHWGQKRAEPKPPGSCARDYCKRPRVATGKLCQHHREIAARASAAYKEREKTMAQADYQRKSTKTGKTDEWNGFNIKFKITALDGDTYETVEHKGYLLTRENEDGSLYGINVHMGKPGGAQSWVDQWARQFTKNLHAGAPLIELLKDGLRQQFEPSGATNMPGIARCGSPIDLVCKIVLKKYLPAEWAEMQGKTEEVKP